jgi:hypothetical protein
MLNKEQSHQLRKLKGLYWNHCLADDSKMTRVDNHFLFRNGKSARCCYADDETKEEFEKVKHMIFLATLL